MTNTWQGDFPHQNLAADGFERISRVTAFPADGYGLHDMIGNVWEGIGDWCSQKHEPYALKVCCIQQNPRGEDRWASYDSCQPKSQDSPQGAERRLASLAPTTAAAIVRPRVMSSRSTHQRATSASGASLGRGSCHEQR